MKTHQTNKQLLATIITHILDSDVVITPDSLWDDAFSAGLDPLFVELAAYSLEASTKQSVSDDFYEGSVDKLFGQTVGSFIDTFLDEEVSDEPLFVTRVMAKFAQSTLWEAQEDESE
jgi:hypothetical protein